MNLETSHATDLHGFTQISTDKTLCYVTFARYQNGGQKNLRKSLIFCANPCSSVAQAQLPFLR
jgi:hypothetical protein